MANANKLHSTQRKYMWMEIERFSYSQNIRGWRWGDSVTVSNLSVDKWTISVKVFEVFKLMPTSLLLPRWEVMIDNVQAERCVACLYTLALRRLKRKGSWGFGSNWVKQWNQSGLCGEILSQKTKQQKPSTRRFHVVSKRAAKLHSN